MDKQVVRETKFRHVYSKTCRKEVSVWNVKPGNESLLKTNGIYWALPWASVGGGSVGIFPVTKTGKLADAPPVLNAHSEAVLDLEFSPLDSTLLVTGSRESTIKLWKLPSVTTELDAYLSKKESASSAVLLVAHSKRPALTKFHPIASNLLLTTSFDLTAKLWDLEAGKATMSSPIADSSVTSMAWSPDGKTFAVATAKDKSLRLYDPRAGTPLLRETVAHDGAAKGFQVLYLEGSRMLTVGFSAKSERQLALWNTSDLSKPLSTQVIDIDSSILYPSYDEGTGLLFLSGRGSSMTYYEINNEEPFAHFVNKASLQGTYSVTAGLPKRFCDVSQCEVARFLKLGSNTVDTVSYFVPRKTSWFQEDLYPPVASGEAAITGKEWLAGKNAPRATVSLKPAGLVSVYDVPEEEGGKNRRTEETKRLEKTGQVAAGGSGPSSSSGGKSASRIKEGKLTWEYKGWFKSTWNERWVNIQNDMIHVFPNEESAAAQFSIPLNLISQVQEDEEFQNRFCVVTSEGQRFNFEVPSSEQNTTSEVWIESILAYKKEMEFATSPSASSSSKEKKPKESKEEVEEEEGEAFQDTEGPLEGWLMIHNQGWFFESWPRRWFVLKKEENILYSYPSKETTRVHHIDNFHLAKTIAITRSENVSYQQWTFKLCSLGQVAHLAAESEEKRDYWTRRLEFYRRKHQLETEFGSGAASCLSSEMIDDGGSQQHLETYIFKKGTGVFGFGGRWQRMWMAAVGKEIIYYKTHTGQQALERTSISMVTAVAPSRGNDKEFEFRLNDGKVIYHLAESVEDRDRWISYVENKRRQFMDLLTVLGIDEEKLESTKDIEGLPNMIDPVEVKNGKHHLLIQVVGKRRIRTVLVPLSIKSLNSHSAYVLDAGMKIYRWNGKHASRVAKAKAMDVATKLRMKERGGKANIIVLDQGKSDNLDAEFWITLGANNNKAASEIKEDPEITVDTSPNSRLYLVAAKDEERPKALRVKMIHEASPPPKEMLDTQNVYVLDTDTEVFVWIGKVSKSQERKLALNIAKKLSLQNNEKAGEEESKVQRPPKFITKVFENGETILFKEKFLNYPGMLPISTQKQTLRSNVAHTQVQEPIDIAKLHSTLPTPAEMIDDGSGRIEMWVIEGPEKIAVDPSQIGRLFSGESYIVLYRYKKANKDCAVIYFWQGRDSTRNEKGTSAYLTIDLNEKLGSEVQHQFRVVQNKEQPHFLQIFKKRSPSGLITFLGKYRQDISDKIALFEVIGDTDEEVRTQEVEAKTSSLNTLHCYILRTPSQVFLWKGSLSSESEKTLARASASTLRKDEGQSVVELEEGLENDAFWKPLGGDGEYLGNGSAINATLSKRYPVGWPKVFLCSNASGSVKIDRIFDFSLEDMDIYREHVLILDTFYEVYVWISPASFPIERKMAMETAIEYVSKSNKGHLTTAPIWVTYPYQEPPGFTSFVSGWAHRSPPAPSSSSSSSAPAKVLPIFKMPVNEILKDYTREVYTLDELKKDPLPVGVDPKRLETYLSDKEFESIMKMTKEDFFKLPKWRADILKNEAGLL